MGTDPSRAPAFRNVPRAAAKGVRERRLPRPVQLGRGLRGRGRERRAPITIAARRRGRRHSSGARRGPSVLAEVVRGAFSRHPALGRAEEAGELAVTVEGSPAYYPRFDFEQASALGFISPHPKIPDDAFMVNAPGLQPRPRRSGRLSGRVRRSRVLTTGRRRAAHSARRNVPCEVPERLETLGWASVQECRPST